MRKIISIILFLFLSLPVWSNQITGMRYYWDNDSTNTTELTGADGSWNEILENSIASNVLTPISEGSHFLNISTRDINGWGEVRTFPVYVETSSPISVSVFFNKILSMEYYWNDDEGITVSLTSEDGNYGEILEKAISENISTPTTAGHHSLNIRTQDLNGWSEVRSFPIFIEENQTYDISMFFNKIISMEYYWDDNAGTTVDLTSFDGSYNEILEKAIAEHISTPATPGHHSLNIRTQDINGWSEARSFPIFIEENQTYDVSFDNLEVIKMEYFIGSDPGVGAGTDFLQLNFTQSKAVAEVTQQFSSSVFYRGVNVIGVRTQDHNNNWSDTRFFTIYVEADSEPYAPIITGPDSTSFAKADSCLYSINREIEATYEWFVTGGTILEFDDYHAVINWDTLASNHQLKVVGTNTYGTGDTATLNVFVEPLPILVINANGNDLRVTNDNRWEYQWLERGVPIIGSTTFRHWVTVNGSYRARVVTQYGDTVLSNELDVYFDPNQKKDVTTSERDSIVHDSIKDTITTITYQGDIGKEDTLVITAVIDSLSDSVWTITDSIWNGSVFNSSEPVFKEFILNIDTISLDTVINEYKPTITISERDTTTFGIQRDTIITTTYKGTIGKEDTVIVTHVVDSLFDSLWIIVDTLSDNVVVSHSDPILSNISISVGTISIDTVVKEYQPIITTVERDSTVHDSLRDTIITTTYEGSIGQEDTIITTLIVDSLFDSIWVITDTLWDGLVVASSLPDFSELIITVDTVFLDTVIKKGGITEISEENEVSYYPNKLLFAPNPVNINDEKIFICTPEDMVGVMKISIFDNMGNLLDTKTFNSKDAKNYSWDLKNRSGRKIVPGTYIATLTFKDKKGSIVNYKFIIGVEE